MKRNRIIAAVLSFVMIFGMFAAFPAMTTTKVSASSNTNYATNASYRFDAAVGTNGTGSFGDGENWTSYHQGKLNDGTIATGSSTGTTTSIEVCYGDVTALKSGTITVYYKFSSAVTVSEVNVFAGRRDNPYRGFFDTMNVYVGLAETDTETVNLLGSVSGNEYVLHNNSAYVRNYNVSGVPKVGTYVIIQFVISSTNSSSTDGKGVLNLSEIQIFATPNRLSNVARDAQYKYSDNTGANGTTAWGDGTSLTTYKSGKLNNGYIATGATTETSFVLAV